MTTEIGTKPLFYRSFHFFFYLQFFHFKFNGPNPKRWVPRHNSRLVRPEVSVVPRLVLLVVIIIIVVKLGLNFAESVNSFVNKTKRSTPLKNYVQIKWIDSISGRGLYFYPMHRWSQNNMSRREKCTTRRNWAAWPVFSPHSRRFSLQTER